MDRVSASGNQVISGGRRTFRNKNLGAGLAGTTLDQLWLAGVQESIIGSFEAVGLTPADATLGSPDTQLLQAIRIIASANGTGIITASGSVTAANAGLIPVDATAANITIALPAAASANGQPFRYKFVRLDSTVHTVTINLAGGDALLVTGGTSVTLTSLALVDLVGDGVSKWLSTAPVSPANFPSSLGGNGWKKYPDPNSPSGYFIEQWATGSSLSFPQTVTLPIAMPNALLRVIATEGHPSGGWSGTSVTVHAAEISSFTPANFSIYSLFSVGSGWNGPTGSGLAYQYIAKGY